MQSKRMLTITLMAFAVISFVNCDANQIVTQIDNIDLEKQVLSNSKQYAIGNLSAAGDSVKTAYMERQQAHTNSQQGYSEYYNERIRCDGLEGSLPFLGVTPSLPNDFCLIAPIGSQAHDVFVGSLQLEHKTAFKEIQQKIVDDYAAFLQDALNQLAVYNRYSAIAYGPLSRAAQRYRDCMAANSSSSNPHPAVCDQYQQQINAKELIYGKFRTIEESFGRSTKTPTFALQAQQQILANLTSDYNSFNTQLQPKIQQLNSLKSDCDSGLQSYLSIINSRLAISLNKQNIVQSARTYAQTFTSLLDSLLGQTKPKTQQIQGLQADLKALF